MKPILTALALAAIGLHAPSWALLWFGAAVGVLVLAAIDHVADSLRGARW